MSQNFVRYSPDVAQTSQ